MNSCKKIRKSLSSWLDGELNPADTETVRLHVESCPECGAERRQLEKLQSALKSLLVPEKTAIAFEPFWRGLEQRIAEERPWHHEFADWLRSPFVAARLAWAVPVAILLLIGVFSLESYWPIGMLGAQRNNFASVESIDAHGRNVALFRENETKTTVIWIYQNQEGEDESSGETTEKSPSF